MKKMSTEMLIFWFGIAALAWFLLVILLVRAHS